MRAAAIVNGTARGVDARHRRELPHALPGGVTFTHSLGEARAAIRAAVARGVDLIVLGGGDGTFIMGLVLIGEACRGAGRPEPTIGVLRLGAVSSIAEAAGAGGDPAADLARLARGEGEWRPMRMLRVLGLRAPFVSIGEAAQALEDREAVERVVERVPGARRLVPGAARAALSIALRSVGRLAAPPPAHAVISNFGAPAIELSPRGAGPSIAPGDALFRGPCSVVACSTIPDPLGRGARRRPPAPPPGDRFRLSCGDAGWLDLLRGAPAALRGGPAAGLEGDFLCDHVEIQLDRELPIAAGGERIGRLRQLEISLGDPVIVAALGGDPR